MKLRSQREKVSVIKFSGSTSVLSNHPVTGSLFYGSSLEDGKVGSRSLLSSALLEEERSVNTFASWKLVGKCKLVRG